MLSAIILSNSMTNSFDYTKSVCITLFGGSHTDPWLGDWQWRAGAYIEHRYP